MVELVAAGARRVGLGGSLASVAVDAVVSVWRRPSASRGELSLGLGRPLPDWYV